MTTRKPRPPCALEDCSSPVFCRGWCSKHYARWQRHGDPLATTRQSPQSGELRRCPRCGEIKALDAYRRRSRTGAPSGYCTACMDKYTEEYVATEHGRERKRSAATGWTRRNKGYFLNRYYNLTMADYEAMLAVQDGRCAICRTSEPGGNSGYFHVDHCHESGRVRGLLCTRCNMGLGMFKDDLIRLRAAIVYLESS